MITPLLGVSGVMDSHKFSFWRIVWTQGGNILWKVLFIIKNFYNNNGSTDINVIHNNEFLVKETRW